MGYGKVWRAECGKKIFAHRVAWELVKGEIPQDQCVLHRCDNPQCVNPDHLFLGSHKDNAADRDAKGRQSPPPHPRGEAHPGAKLKRAQVDAIRSRWENRPAGLTKKKLARQYGVTPTQIGTILSGDQWR